MDEFENRKKVSLYGFFGKIPVSRFCWIALAIIFVAFAIEAWTFMVPFYTISGLITYFVGLLISAAFLSVKAGVYLFVPINDTLMRKRTIIIGILLEETRDKNLK